jgi:hypothetical protein
MIRNQKEKCNKNARERGYITKTKIKLYDLIGSPKIICTTHYGKSYKRHLVFASVVRD